MTAPERGRLLLAAGVLLAAAALLFVELGHYALWDDEANTAMSAQAVLRTGDTSAWVSDHNLLAYRKGAELRDLHLRYIPPLQAYLAAPSLALFGATAWAARLPFALCGLAAVALMLWWMWRAGASGRLWLLMSLGILGNVSLFLYLRQSRYYAPAALCTLVIAYCYTRRDVQRGWLPAMTIASIALLASNYLNYAALYVCLALDYALWGRRERPLAPREWLLLLAPQLVAAALIVPVWNPLALQVEASVPQGLADRLLLLWWNVRELNLCEFGAAPLLALAPLLWKSQPWLARASLALAVYLVTITLASPQVISDLPTAPVRYLVPLIPLCIFITAAVLAVLTRRSIGLAIAAGALVFGTNVAHGGPLTSAGVRSTIVEYIGELLHPPVDPYTVAADWINANVRPGQSIWVMPPYMKYPLMFHAPHAVYAWQLAWPPAPQFQGLPAIHFEMQGVPDYVITFSPMVLKTLSERGYVDPAAKIATLDVFWKDLHRPELTWRSFRTVTNYDRDRDAVYVFGPPPAMAPAASP